jgi:prefoldin subunit 5
MSVEEHLKEAKKLYRKAIEEFERARKKMMEQF